MTQFTQFVQHILFLVVLILPHTAFAKTGVLVAIVPAVNKGAADVKGELQKFVKVPIGREYDLLSTKEFRAVGRRIDVTGKDLLSVEAAVLVGAEAGVSYVVFLESQVERRSGKGGNKKQFFIEVTVVDVAAGDITFASRYELEGKRLGPRVGETLLAELIAALAQTQEPPADQAGGEEARPILEFAAPEAPPAPSMPQPPSAPPASEAVSEEPPMNVEAGESATPTSNELALETDVADVAELGEVPAEQQGASEPAPPMEASAAKVVPPPTALQGPRPGLQLQGGLLYAWRSARINDRYGQRVHGYEGPVQGLLLNADLFPLAFGGRGHWYEGVGIHLAGNFQRTKTLVDASTNEQVISYVRGGEAGAVFRYILWDVARRPELAVEAGYSFFTFPLSEGSFPGTGYAGFYLGGKTLVRIFGPFSLIARGAYYPRITVRDSPVKSLGEARADHRPHGFRLAGGLRVSVAAIDIEASGRIEQYDADFVGHTGFRKTLNLQQNVSLRDRFLSGSVTAGMAF